MSVYVVILLSSTFLCAFGIGVFLGREHERLSKWTHPKLSAKELDKIATQCQIAELTRHLDTLNK